MAFPSTGEKGVAVKCRGRDVSVGLPDEVAPDVRVDDAVGAGDFDGAAEVGVLGCAV